MNSKSPDLNAAVRAAARNPIRNALALFLEAHEYAREVQQSDWEFAVELAALLEAGCSRSALRWLTARGFLEHAWEKTRLNASSRSFKKTANLSLAANSCFVLTPSGIMMARQLEQARGAVADVQEYENMRLDQVNNGYPLPHLPHWDSKLRELRLGTALIKAFTQPSPNQETILAVFQEEGWPVRIDNPLPPQHLEDGNRRLHDTITRLNRHQRHRVIRFRSDNNGEGVRWAIIAAATAAEQSRTR